MNKQITSLLISGFILLVIQVVILNNIYIDLPILRRMKLFIYPLVIMLLPKDANRYLLLIMAFVTGMIVDLFDQSLGMHAGALVFATFLRSGILTITEPTQGYHATGVLSLRAYGSAWFIQYGALFLFVHCLAYYFLDYFSLEFIVDILINASISTLFSLILVFLYQILFGSDSDR